MKRVEQHRSGGSILESKKGLKDECMQWQALITDLALNEGAHSAFRVTHDLDIFDFRVF